MIPIMRRFAEVPPRSEPLHRWGVSEPLVPDYGDLDEMPPDWIESWVLGPDAEEAESDEGDEA
ncbi:MAG: hypothetical protein ABI369_05790 [Acetobacteraceae bacterium]